MENPYAQVTKNRSRVEARPERDAMDTQVMNPNRMFASGRAPRQSGGWFRGLAALRREATEICAKIDRELPIAEARAERLLRHYGI